MLLVFTYTKYHKSLVNIILSSPHMSSDEIVFFDTCFVGYGRLKKLFYTIYNILLFFYCRIMLLAGKEINILLPHPEQLLANYFFYSNKVDNRYIFEDGLMNYYDARLSGGNLKRAKKRRLSACCLFYRYNIVSGYLSGCDDRIIKGTFAKFIDMLYKPEKHGELFEIATHAVNSVMPLYNTALFLDQDVETIYGHNIASCLRSHINTFLQRFDRVYVKKHHDYLCSQSLQSLPLNNLCDLDSNLNIIPAEDVVEVLKPFVVVSFTSTALINIASRHKNIKCYYCLPESHMVDTVLGNIPLSELFNKFGVLAVDLCDA